MLWLGVAGVAGVVGVARVGVGDGRWRVFLSSMCRTSAQADDALAPGDPNEKLGELNNVPVTRKDMATLRPTEWLNDEVVNYFFEIMKVRACRMRVWWPSQVWWWVRWWVVIPTPPLTHRNPLAAPRRADRQGLQA